MFKKSKNCSLYLKSMQVQHQMYRNDNKYFNLQIPMNTTKGRKNQKFARMRFVKSETYSLISIT